MAAVSFVVGRSEAVTCATVRVRGAERSMRGPIVAVWYVTTGVATLSTTDAHVREDLATLSGSFGVAVIDVMGVSVVVRLAINVVRGATKSFSEAQSRMSSATTAVSSAVTPVTTDMTGIMAHAVELMAAVTESVAAVTRVMASVTRVAADSTRSMAVVTAFVAVVTSTMALLTALVAPLTMSMTLTKTFLGGVKRRSLAPAGRLPGGAPAKSNAHPYSRSSH